MLETELGVDELEKWWSIAQLAGAGASLVLGPVVVALWRRNGADNTYIRNTNKQTLETLADMTSVIRESDLSQKTRHTELIGKIEALSQTIREDIVRRGS